MTFLDPVWLVLALPLAASLWLFPQPSRLTNLLRVMAIVLAVLAVSGLSMKLPSRAGTIVVVADRSRSMPHDCDATHKELIDLLQSGMGTNDNLAVVSFGQTAAIEQSPETGRFPGFTHVVGQDASNLGDAIDAALSLVPKDSPGRLLILSDGRWTGHDPLRSGVVAASRNVAIDYRHMARPTAGDLSIARVDAPAMVGPGEGFLVTTWVQSPIEQTIDFEVTRAGKAIASGERKVTAGLNRLTFRDLAGHSGSHAYQIRVAGRTEDPVPENNVARILVGVSGTKPILHLTPGPSSGLTSLLRAGGLNVIAMQPESVELSLTELSGYSAVILENIPAEKLGTRGMETLAAWVKATGSGLMMTGGFNSYGQGGYYKSPLEPILPVSLELRQEHRKFAVAIVVVLDRSGSMAVSVPGGKVKMDLANLGTASVLDMLGPNDEFGCIAVDTLPHTIAKLGQVTNKSTTRDKILSIQSMGGGIYIDVALVAGSEMILPANSGTKHIVLFADAADSEQPGNYKELLAAATKAGITVSAIGLGTPMDKDVGLLQDIAMRGGGRFMITNQPEELPRLFAQDTFLVARNTFVDEPVNMQATVGLKSIAGRSFGLEKSIGGYNLCYLRPEATMGVYTLDEYKAPTVASWQSGSGRVLCYTGEVDGKYAGAFAKSSEAGDFYTTLARWTAGETGQLGEGMALTQELRNGVNRIQLHLDPDRKADPFAGNPQLTTLRGKQGEGSRTETIQLSWIGPDTLAAEIPLEGVETALSTVMIPGQKPQQLTPVCLPYSPEFAPELGDGERGRTTLERLARSTGGIERIELAKVWNDLPRRSRFFSLTPWMLLAAVLCLLLEVLERRTGFVSRIVLAIACQLRWFTRVPQLMKTSVLSTSTPKAEQASSSSAPASAPTKSAPPAATKPEVKDDLLSAMKKARERMRERSD
ncbi:MAG TPA: VWA domain-containing protein [Gemmata sp.]|nr:VWA domain-containing protein [Gemmata sp.]